MSAALAAGCARSRFQSVSVVPMNQKFPHGITNSRLVAVRVMMPGARADPLARHDEVDALRRAHPELPAAADHLLDLVDPDPGRVDHVLGAHLDLGARLEVGDRGAGDPPGRAREAGDPGAAGDERAVVGGRAGDHHRVPGVVDLALVERDRPGQRARLRRRERLVRRPPAVVLAGARGRRDRRPSRRRRRCRDRRTRGRSPSSAAGRGTRPGARGAGRASRGRACAP